MKQFYVFLLLSFYFLNHSQNFTNGSVYNYNVGDTIVTSYVEFTNAQGGQSPPEWTYRIFTGKQFSANMDTVFYTVHDVVTSYTCYPCHQIITSQNSTLGITNLSDSVINFPFSTSSCGTRIDTSYVNACGLWEHDAYLHYAPANNMCFEPPTLAYTVIEGVGVFEHTLSLNAAYPGPAGFKTQLEWYRKGANRCGQSYGIPDGISEVTQAIEKLKVYPNPSKNDYVIDSNEEGILTVVDFSGREILKEIISVEYKKVNLVNFSEGIYTFKFKTAKRIYLAKVVKE